MIVNMWLSKIILGYVPIVGTGPLICCMSTMKGGSGGSDEGKEKEQEK